MARCHKCHSKDVRRFPRKTLANGEVRRWSRCNRCGEVTLSLPLKEISRP